MLKDGERTTISSRVAELDQIVPQYLGVSEAILDSVIFCHQDESLWPMSEPGTLKKKFDEIFEALKYTKAIENIKAVRKTQNSELAKHKIFEDNFKTDKDRGDRAEKKSLALQAEIEVLRTQIDQINIDITKARDEASAKHKQSMSYLSIITELESKRNRAQEREENINDVWTNLEELSESDEWLESTLAQYEERMDRYREEEQDHRKQYHEATEELKNIRNRLSTRLAEKGQYQAEKENYERQLDARVSLVRDAARRHAIRGFDGELDQAQIREFVDRIGKLSREKARELERVQNATEDELKQAQSVLTDLETRRSARTQDKVSAKQTISGNERKMNSIQNEVDEITIDEGAKAVLDSSHKSLSERLSKGNIDFETAAWDRQIQVENAQLRGLEEESERLNEEFVRSTHLAEERAHLTFVKKELNDRQRSLDTMVAAHGSKLNPLLGPKWKVSTIEREFQVTLDQKAESVKDAQTQRDIVSREMEQVEFKLSSSRDAWKKKSFEMETSQDAVLKSVFIEGQPLHSVDDYLAEVAQMESDRDIFKSDLENYIHLENFWNKCLNAANVQDKCLVCERKFVNQEKSSAITKLRQRLATDNRSAIQADLEKIGDEIKGAQAARPHYETYKRLAEIELPALEKDVKTAENRRNTLLARLEELDAVVGQETLAKREVEALGKTVTNIARYHKEITTFNEDIERLSSQHKSSGSSLSLGEIQEQLSANGDLTRTLRGKVSKIIIDKDRAKAAINVLELELRDTLNKQSTANHQIEKKGGLRSRIQELKESINTQREVIQRADSELDSLSPQIAKARVEYADVQQRGRSRENEIHEDNSRLSDTVNKLKTADDAISSYIDGGGPNKLLTCQRAIKAMEQEISAADTEISTITMKTNKLKAQVDNSEKTKRSISDNIKFRRNLKALEILRAEIAELESRNATEDYKRLQAEASRLDLRHQTLMAERGPLMGSMTAKDEELARLLVEWEADYKDAARNYREAHIKVETTKAAIEDLGRYGAALDQAIMKYHSMKMEEINRIAGELWQSTYQGTDVDTILIRSENDTSTSANKKSYNYRVCMVKQDAEMDMRGRCSAGQRVLASIIIRLALAECFGVNCGVSLFSGKVPYSY
jgi:DNA repair protein RAD50